MSVGSIKFQITADLKGLQSSLNQASSSINRTASEIKGSNGVLSKMSGLFKGVGSAAVGAVAKMGKMAYSITIFKAVNAALETLGSAVSTAFNRMDTMLMFEKAMTRITGSSEEAKKVLEDVNTVVKGTPYGLDVAAKAVQGFANSNLGVKESVKYVEAWGNAISAYGDGSNDTLQRVTFALNKMASKGKVSLEELNVAMEAGIPAIDIYAEATGQSVAEVRDQITAGEISATQFLDTMTGAFENGTEHFKSISGAAKQAGETWRGTIDNMRMAVARGVEAIVNSLDAGLKDAGLLTLKEFITEIGVRTEAGMKQLPSIIGGELTLLKDVFQSNWDTITAVCQKFIETVLEVGRHLAETFSTVILPAIFDSLGKVNSELDTSGMSMADILKGVIDIMVGVFLGLKDVFDALFPIFMDFVAHMQKIWEAVKEFLPEGTNLTDVVRQITPVVLALVAGFKALKLAFSFCGKVLQTIELLRTFKSAVGGGVRAMSKLSPAAKVLATAFKTMGNVAKLAFSGAKVAFMALGKAILAHPIIATIAAVIAVIVLLWNKCEWFRDGVIAIWEAVKQAFFDAKDYISEALTKAGEAVSDVGKSMGDGLKKAGETISDVFKRIGEWISNAFNTIKNVVKVGCMAVAEIVKGIITVISALVETAFNWIAYVIEVTWEAIKAACKIAWEAIWQVIEPAVTAISDFISEKWTAIKDFFSRFWEGVVLLFTTVWDFIKDKISTSIDIISEKISTAWEAIKNFFSVILESIKTIVSDAWNAIKEQTSIIWTAIKDFFTPIWQAIEETALAAAQAIKSAIDTAWNWIKETTAAIWTAIKDFFSNLWNQITNLISIAIQNMKDHINNQWQAIKLITETLWTAISTKLSEIWESIKTTVGNAIETVRNVISTVWESIKTTTENIWNGIKNAITKPIEEAKQVIEDIINGIQEFFNSVKLEMPEIKRPKLPKFSISGSFSLDPPSVPSVGLDWFATGGIFTSPSVIGVGEAGSEAVLPLSNKSRMKPFAQAVAGFMPEGSGGGADDASIEVVISGNTFIVRDENDTRKIGQSLAEEAARRFRAKGKVK